MKKIIVFLPLLALASSVGASSFRGSLSNFDAINDSGETVYGMEIELDDIRSRDVTGTYPGNHYGYGKVREDLSDPNHPKVFVHYEQPTPSGLQTGFTIAPSTPPGSCYNLSLNVGCEHFGVHLSKLATAVKYNWLVKRNGKVIVGPALNISAPTYVYTPPVTGFPAQVVATIPAPVVPIPASKEFGEPSWVKVIKTKTHSQRTIQLSELISEDHDGDGRNDWTNGEPDEVESEWYLLQTNNKKPAKNELEGRADSMGSNASGTEGDKVVTRRYEFYAYAGPSASIDGENGEAMCDKVSPDNIYGEGVVEVTNSNGDPVEYDCASAPIVGNYLGSQMSGFMALMPFQAADALQGGNVNQLYPERPVVSGGNTPYNIQLTAGVLPNGLTIQPLTGLLYGVPSKVGVFNFSISARDSNAVPVVVKDFTVKVTGPGDVDGDNDIDIADLNRIKAKYNTRVSAGDPADLNGDLLVNIADYRKAATLCTLPQCALVTP